MVPPSRMVFLALTFSFHYDHICLKKARLDIMRIWTLNPQKYTGKECCISVHECFRDKQKKHFLVAKADLVELSTSVFGHFSVGVKIISRFWPPLSLFCLKLTWRWVFRIERGNISPIQNYEVLKIIVPWKCLEFSSDFNTFLVYQRYL